MRLDLTEYIRSKNLSTGKNYKKNKGFKALPFKA